MPAGIAVETAQRDEPAVAHLGEVPNAGLTLRLPLPEVFRPKVDDEDIEMTPSQRDDPAEVHHGEVRCRRLHGRRARGARSANATNRPATITALRRYL